MKRAIIAAALAAVMAAAMTGAALTGEVTGNGKPTPINGYRAWSICCSPARTTFQRGGLFNGGRVQSFGDIVQEAIRTPGIGDGHGASAFVSTITGMVPASTAGATRSSGH